MLKQKEVENLVEKLVKKFSKIKTIIQFGSSVSGDYNKDFSDVDLAIIPSNKKIEKQIKNFIFKYHSSFELQTHIFSARDFIKGLKEGLPINLSIIYTGKQLSGKGYFLKLKNRNFKPTKSTVRKCMLNSFAALGLAISDLTHGMIFDPVNYIYHAARSSIWAALFDKHITPNNKQIFILINNKVITDLYRKMVRSREKPAYYGDDLSICEEIYKKGNINQVTQMLKDATKLIKINYKKIFGKNFIGLFELLNISKKRYAEIPKFYSILLSVDWENEILRYAVVLSFDDNKRLMLEVNANNGDIKEVLLK